MLGKKFVGAGLTVDRRGDILVPEVYMEVDSTIVARQPLPELQRGSEIEIRLEIDTRANRYAYSYSIDGGKNFKPLGEPFDMRDGFWKGVRTGLYAYTLSDDPGQTRFARFRYRHDGNPQF